MGLLSALRWDNTLNLDSICPTDCRRTFLDRAKYQGHRSEVAYLDSYCSGLAGGVCWVQVMCVWIRGAKMSGLALWTDESLNGEVDNMGEVFTVTKYQKLLDNWKTLRMCSECVSLLHRTPGGCTSGADGRVFASCIDCDHKGVTSTKLVFPGDNGQSHSDRNVYTAKPWVVRITVAENRY